MEKEHDKNDEFLYSEIRNPMYQALENQLRLEFEWAYADKNLYSLSWIALNLEKLSKEDLKKIMDLVEDALNELKKGKLTTFVTTEFILGLCFSTRIIYDKRGRVPSDLLCNLNELLNEARKRSWLRNHEFVSLIAKFLPEIDEFNVIIKEATLWVATKYQEFFKEGDYEKAIDCIFGLEGKRNFQLNQDLLQEILRHLNEIPDETLAKLCIMLKNDSKEFSAKFIRELERRIETEFKGFLGPSLERGLRELITLLNSGYSTETIQLILETKRREGYEWAKDVRAGDKRIVIEHIPELGELPRIDPKTHALAFKALELHNRSSIIALNRDEFSKLKEAFDSTKRGYLGVRKMEYQMIILIASITSFFTLIFLPDILSKILSFNYMDIITLLENIEQNWFLIFKYGSIPIILFLIWLWFLRVLYNLRRGGEISFTKLIRLIPILGYILQKLLGEGGSTND